MTITFPRELPNVLFTTVDLKLNDGVTASATRGRLVNYTQFADPIWYVSLTTQPLTMDEAAVVEAWALSLRGGLKPALFRHPAHKYPKKHRDNPTPAEDTGVLTSVSNGNVLNVSSVSADLELVVGDHVGLEQSGKFGFFQITNVSGSGTSREITVEPMPYATVRQTGALVRFVAPAMTMRLVPSSLNTQKNGSLYTVSFSLVEV